MTKRALLLTLLVGCAREQPQDDCARAHARLARIETHTAAPSVDRDAVQQCRRSPHALQDPVVRCALDSDSDGAAAVCIDRFTRAVLKPSAEPGSAGRGVNPLLAPR